MTKANNPIKRLALYLVKKNIIPLTKTTWTEGTKFFAAAECEDIPCVVQQDGQEITFIPFFAMGPKYRVTKTSALGLTISKEREEIMTYTC